MTSSVEELYASSLLGGGGSHCLEIRWSRVGCPSHVANRVCKEVRAQCHAIATLRGQQTVLDVLVRQPTADGASTASLLCTPHFTHDIQEATATTRWSRRSIRKARKRMHTRGVSVPKVTPRSKLRFDLTMRLWYTLQRCLRERTSPLGALLPYSVAARTGRRRVSLRASRARNHANFIYLCFQHNDTSSPVTPHVQCVLIEPNGPKEAYAYKDGLSRLRRAWTQLVNEGVFVKGRPLHLDPKVSVLGERNAHTVKDVERNLHALVGVRQVLTSRYRSQRGRVHTTTTTHYRGHGGGICGAVTHWIVDTWLKKRGSRSLEDIYKDLCEQASSDPTETLSKLTTFMRNFGTRIRAQYSKMVDKALQKDMRDLETSMNAKYQQALGTGRVTLHNTFSFGHGNNRLYHQTHTIQVGGHMSSEESVHYVQP